MNNIDFKNFKFDIKDPKTKIILAVVLCAIVVISLLASKNNPQQGDIDIESQVESLNILPADPIDDNGTADITITDGTTDNNKTEPASEPVTPAASGLEMHVIDVGQGDSIYVKCGSKNIVIDAGENGYDETVCNYLKGQGVETIDLVIATHPHSDHIGGLDTVIKSFKCKGVMMPEVPEAMLPTSVAYEKFLKAIDKTKTPYVKPVTGDTYEFDGVTMYIYDDGKGGEDLNSCSIVVKFVYKNTSFLLMADAEKSEENRIMARGYELKADVLKLGHHGSSKATGEKFFDKVNPKYVAISLGANNDYGFPHREIKAMLREKGVKYFRTDLVSTVVFKSDGKNVTVTTAK